MTDLRSELEELGAFHNAIVDALLPDDVASEPGGVKLKRIGKEVQRRIFGYAGGYAILLSEGVVHSAFPRSDFKLAFDEFTECALRQWRVRNQEP